MKSFFKEYGTVILVSAATTVLVKTVIVLLEALL